MIRMALVVGFLLVAVAILIGSYVTGTGTPSGDLMVNLGTEILGIVITLAVVDWLLERRRLQDRARDEAWSVLHALERAVWVWQGGSRRPSSDELLGLIVGIELDAHLEPYARALLVNVGAYARELMNREADAIRTLPGLREALHELTALSSLADGESSRDVPMAGEVLATAAEHLIEVTGGSKQPIPAGLLRGRDPSREGQRTRIAAARGGVRGRDAPSPGGRPRI